MIDTLTEGQWHQSESQGYLRLGKGEPVLFRN